MTAHVKPAPLRESQSYNESNTGPANDDQPADPTRILRGQPLPSSRSRFVVLRNIGIVAGGLFLAELFFPLPLKPSVVIGDAVARFYFRIMTVANDKEIDLKEQAGIAERRAEIEAERSKWIGICALGILLDAEIAAKCQQIANGAFDAAEQSIRQSKEK